MKTVYRNILIVNNTQCLGFIIGTLLKPHTHIFVFYIYLQFKIPYNIVND